MEHGGARSYLDALSEYERITQEAIGLARGKDRDIEVGPEADAVRAVMLRWHLSLTAVLKTGQDMFQHPLEFTTEDIANEE
jgi:hypothetical protein